MKETCVIFSIWLLKYNLKIFNLLSKPSNQNYPVISQPVRRFIYLKSGMEQNKEPSQLVFQKMYDNM